MTTICTEAADEPNFHADLQAEAEQANNGAEQALGLPVGQAKHRVHRELDFGLFRLGSMRLP